jgi:hypothetical protein
MPRVFPKLNLIMASNPIISSIKNGLLATTLLLQTTSAVDIPNTASAPDPIALAKAAQEYGFGNVAFGVALSMLVIGGGLLVYIFRSSEARQDKTLSTFNEYQAQALAASERRFEKQGDTFTKAMQDMSTGIAAIGGDLRDLTVRVDEVHVDMQLIKNKIERRVSSRTDAPQSS